MASLKDILTAVQSELDDALAGTAGGLSLEADRVQLSLPLSIIPRKKSGSGVDLQFGLPAGKSKLSKDGASLMIELRVRPPADRKASATTRSSPLQPRSDLTDEKEIERVIETLGKVFGAPGFDSSARATVFREAFEGLSGESIKKLFAALKSPSVVPADLKIKNSLHRIGGVLRSSPLKSQERASQLVIEVFHRHDVPGVLSLIANRWKTQDDWIHPA